MGLFNRESHNVVADVSPPIRSAKLTPRPVPAKEATYLAEYAELATLVGIAPPDLMIESFKAFLAAKDLPIYALSEVVAYMDEKSAKESQHKAGWEWRPLREKDNRHQMIFGRPCERPDGRYSPPRLGTPASDYYGGPAHVKEYIYGLSGDGGLPRSFTREYESPAAHRVYDRTIPLHAVRRVALIEKEFADKVAFFISDYALLPEVAYPDPFLMAVIPNVNVARGEGRFVIDFWDEPGFGIDKMLK